MSRPQVLVVDDEPGMRHAVARVLEPACELVACATAAEALDAAAGADLAFVDVRLPDLDGFELMERLQRAHPDLDVVLMTGSLHDMDRKLVQSLRKRAFFFLTKPFGRELLLTVFDRWKELKDLTVRDREHRARLERDQRDARAFQLGLLPPERSVLGDVELRGVFEPCDAVSGDLYDYAVTSSGAVAMLVSDVSGHGVAAAMLCGFLKTVFQASHVDDHCPLAVVDRMRDALTHVDADRFVTLIAARLDARAGRLEYVSAGHPDGLLRRGDGTVEHLGRTGPMVSAAFPHGSWRKATLPVGPGDALLLCTDGIEEARGDGAMFGEERLAAVFAAESQPDAVLGRIDEELRRHCGGRPAEDDHTLLLAWLRGSA